MTKKITILIWILFLIFWISTTFASTWELLNSDISGLSDRLRFLFILVPAALWDSINPCAFAVMFILLSSILQKSGSKNKVLLAWFLFILAVFISYTAMWIGLYHALASSTNTFYLKLTVWIIWILVWLANLKDYFWYGKWFVMEVPFAWRKNMKKILNSIVSPGWAFIVWFIISLFLLPCTSGPYITVLWYLAAESSTINLWWYIYIIMYNIIFIIPMVIITFIIWFWLKSTWELKEIKELNTERIHLITWLIMLALGLYILYDVLL